MESKLIKNNNVELYTESFGDSDGTPILLISGAMAPASFWPDFFCNSMADKGFFVIRFVNRDFGKSTHFEQCRPDSGVQCPYTINDLVKDCISILDGYGIQKANIAGHSLGGSIVQLLTVNHPDRILTSTSLSAPILATSCPDLQSPDPEIEKRTWEIFLSNLMYPDPKNGIPEFIKVWRYLNGDFDLDEQMAIEYTKAIYEYEKIEPAWNHTAIQENVPDIFDDLQHNEIPIMFLNGSKDYLIQNSENVKILEKNIRSAFSHVLQKAGHVFFNKEIWTEIEDVIVNHINRER